MRSCGRTYFDESAVGAKTMILSGEDLARETRFNWGWRWRKGGPHGRGGRLISNRFRGRVEAACWGRHGWAAVTMFSFGNMGGQM